jgi:hypothetical protein
MNTACGASTCLLILLLARPLVQPAAAQHRNDPPEVVPSLRQWSGGLGLFVFEGSSRIVVDWASATELAGDAAAFHDDLQAISGLDLPVLTGGPPGNGDVFLALDRRFGGDQEYELAIDRVVAIRAKTAAGIFYGMQTLLQMVKLDPRHRRLLKGTARDYPEFGDRGFMIDVGHTFMPLAYIETMIRQIAWHKMNTLHIHFTDVGGFRLNSENYPGLADPLRSFTREQIEALEERAKRYHVTIVPEIDIPAHARPMTNYRPSLKFTCRDMIDANNEGWTIDVTKDANRAWVRGLLEEFVPWFDGPVFHIGGDEYEADWKTALCPDIIEYAERRGFGARADVFVDFLNEMNAVVKSLGKRTAIWNWWDVDQVTTIAPDRDIIVQAWTGSPEKYINLGYQTISSQSSVIYAGPGDPPGTDWDADPQSVLWWPMPAAREGLLGFRMATWTGAITGADPPAEYFEWFSRRPREALAERAWRGEVYPRVAEFTDRVDRIGTAPGVPEYAPFGGVKLSGQPFGTEPAWNGTSSTYDKAFDGDVTTFFDYAHANDGYTGIDLGEGEAKPVTKIRFHPRIYAYDGARTLLRMIGGKFQGSNGGPDRGFVDLYTVEWTPENGWNEATVTDTRAYRWLRYLSPDGGFGNVAEIQFYRAGPPPASGDDRALTAGDEGPSPSSIASRESEPTTLFFRQRVLTSPQPLMRVQGAVAAASAERTDTRPAALTALVSQYGVRGLSVGVTRAASASPVTVRIHSLGGRLVRVLVNERLAPGVYEVGWDGLDEGGRAAAPGVYVATLTIGSYRAAQRLILRQP